MMVNQKTSTLLESDEFIDLCNALEENYHNFDCEDDNDIDLIQTFENLEFLVRGLTVLLAKIRSYSGYGYLKDANHFKKNDFYELRKIEFENYYKSATWFVERCEYHIEELKRNY